MNFRYDLNGNMRTNGTRAFEYNDENQLISTWISGVSSNYFVYDGRMRRRIERNYQWTAGAWVLGSESRFIYDGYVILQERDGLNLPTVTLTRGSDLSGSLAGAGGIGGLLALSDHSVLNLGSVSNAHFFYHCDGNGNVTCLADARQNIAARYLYDPFGNTLSIAGPEASINRYRFSSKPIHEASGMYDYLYRWYVPELQRWLNRDPLGEFGGVNLYVFVRNSSVVLVDPLGLDGALLPPPDPTGNFYPGPIPLYPPVRPPPRPPPFPPIPPNLPPGVCPAVFPSEPPWYSKFEEFPWGPVTVYPYLHFPPDLKIHGDDPRPVLPPTAPPNGVHDGWPGLTIQIIF